MEKSSTRRRWLDSFPGSATAADPKTENGRNNLHARGNTGGWIARYLILAGGAYAITHRNFDDPQALLHGPDLHLDGPSVIALLHVQRIERTTPDRAEW